MCPKSPLLVSFYSKNGLLKSPLGDFQESPEIVRALVIEVDQLFFNYVVALEISVKCLWLQFNSLHPKVTFLTFVSIVVYYIGTLSS